MSILSKLHKNGIATSYIDCYCLVCNTQLNSEKEAFTHITISSHVKNFESTSYVDKYKDEYIRKIKKIYFCECCNLILLTLSKVSLHMQDSNHAANKTNLILQRDGSTIIAYGTLVISERAWNGFIDDTCNICNKEFDNEEEHKTDETHMLNLLQSKVEFATNKNVFRKVDDQTVQCLTCNEVLHKNNVKTHCESSAHKKKYADSQKCNKSNGAKPKVATNQPLFKLGFLNMNDNTKKPVVATKPAETPKHVTNTQSAKNTEEANNDCLINKHYTDIDKEICKILNAENYITDEESGQKWCILCDWTMNPDVVSIHLSGKHHENMLRLHKRRLEMKDKLRQADQKNKTTDTPKPAQENKAQNVKETQADKENSPESAVILDSLERYQKSDININFVSNTVCCRKCNESIDFNHLAIDKHIQDHKKKDLESFVEEQMAKGTLKEPKQEAKPIKKPIKKSKPVDKAAEQFAKDNNLEHAGPNKALCKICNATVPFHVKNMQEHLEGKWHQSFILKTVSREKQVVTRTPSLQFVKSVIACEIGPFKDFVINQKYVINMDSFQTLMYCSTMDTICFVCDDYYVVNKDVHVSLESHKEALENSNVVTSKSDEFIREPRPGEYHCGFCNWASHGDCGGEELGQHLASAEHADGARSARWRLEQYRSTLREQKPNVVQNVFASLKRAYY